MVATPNNALNLSSTTAGQVVQAQATGVPTFSTATYPATATGTGTILRADGTNWAATTATYPTTTTSQQILYSTAANVVGQLTTANSAIAATNSSGTLAMRAFSVNIQTFTISGTYTPTAGMLYCVIECVGGGGGGGGSANSAASQGTAGGGGGGGGYARKFASAATIGVSQTVTIGSAGTAGTAGNNPGGNGGDTSVGAICIGKGGTGGGGNNGNGNGASGAGGIAGTGDITFPGQPGGLGLNVPPATTTSFTSYGGSSYFGTGAASVASTGANVTGGAGNNYGGGGGGGLSFQSGGTAAGGAGTTGVITITEYVIA